jgi:hypothetical protein
LRLRALLHADRSLRANSLTSPTYNTIVLHLVGFLGVLRKGFEQYSHRALEPSLLGEWQCEQLFSLARDPGCQRTSNFSAHQFMEKVNKTLHLQNDEHVKEKWKQPGREYLHDVSCYMPALNVQQLHEAMELGWSLWRDVAIVHGYGEMMEQYPSLPLQYAQLLKVTKPELGEEVSWEDWYAYIVQNAEVAEVTMVESAAAAPDVVRQRYAQELEPLLDGCQAVMSCTHHEVREAEVDVGPVAADVGQLLSKQAAEHAVAVVYNATLRKQCKDTLGRFQAGSLRVPGSFVCDEGSGEKMKIGQTFSFLFDVSGEVCLYVGRIRSLIAAAKSSRSGGLRTQIYTEVHSDNATVKYFCHPYAKVVCTSDGDVTLEVCEHEKPEWFQLVRASAEHATVQEDSDSEYEEEGKDVAGAGSQVCHVSNVLEEVSGVVWNEAGAFATPSAAEQLVKLLAKHPQVTKKKGKGASKPRKRKRGGKEV